MDINERIKELRKNEGLTLEKFGARLGVSKVAISLIENKKSSVTEQMFKMICNEFSVNPEWLRDGTGSMYVVLDEEDELMKAMVDLQLSDVDNEAAAFRKKFLTILLKMPDEDWAIIRKYIKELAEE